MAAVKIVCEVFIYKYNKSRKVPNLIVFESLVFSDLSIADKIS